MPKSPLDRPEMAEQTTAAGMLSRTVKRPSANHEVERQYDQEDAEDQDQHLQIQGGGQKDGKGAARDVDQQGEGQPPEGDTASKAEGQRIIQKQERCGGYGRGVQHIQKKGEDHHDDDPSAKADHGLDGSRPEGRSQRSTPGPHTTSPDRFSQPPESGRVLLL